MRPTLWAGRLDINMATRKKHTPEQVVRKLATADRMLNEGKDVADVCRELQVSEQTYYRWRNQFGGMNADDAKRLRDLERENATLKRLLADAGQPAPSHDRLSLTGHLCHVLQVAVAVAYCGRPVGR